MVGYGSGGLACPGHGYGYGAGGFGPWGLALMGIFWLVVVVGVILLIVWAVRRGAHHVPLAAPPLSERSVQIVRERYARGEIEQEEYRRLIDDLR